MNNHDQQRISQVKKTLSKAKYELEIVLLYLTVSNNPDPVEVADLKQVEETIDNMLERLESVVVTT